MQKVTETTDDPISTGELQDLAAFKRVMEYPTLPGANNLIGFAGAKDGSVFATRVPRDPRQVLPNAPVSDSIGGASPSLAPALASWPSSGWISPPSARMS